MQQGDGGAVPAQPGRRILYVTREVIRTNGFTGLWRGTTATLLRNVPGVAMYFTGLTQLRTLMATSPYFSSMQAPGKQQSHGSTLPKLSMQGNLVAGAAARVSVGFVLNPFTVLKARYESNLYNYTSLWGAFRSIARGGPSELFLGFWPSAIRDAPYAGLFVVFYEVIKQETGKLVPANSSVQAASVHSFAAASSGAIATLITHPFDVIKTKMQVRSEKRYHGVLQTSATIWRQRGIEGFFDGATLRLSRKVLSSMIGWVVYEGLLIFIQSRTSRKKEEASA